MMQRTKPADGFTLAEVLVSMFLFAISIAAIVSLAISIQEAKRINDYQALSTQSMRVVAEVIRSNTSQYFACSATPIDFSSQLSNIPNAKAFVTITCTDGVYGIKRADIRFTYNVGNVVKTAQTTLYLGNAGLYQ